jgi:hypothetical protein
LFGGQRTVLFQWWADLLKRQRRTGSGAINLQVALPRIIERPNEDFVGLELQDNTRARVRRSALPIFSRRASHSTFLADLNEEISSPAAITGN